jgi:hypothetical protein
MKHCIFWVLLACPFLLSACASLDPRQLQQGAANTDAAAIAEARLAMHIDESEVQSPAEGASSGVASYSPFSPMPFDGVISVPDKSADPQTMILHFAASDDEPSAADANRLVAFGLVAQHHRADVRLMVGPGSQGSSFDQMMRAQRRSKSVLARLPPELPVTTRIDPLVAQDTARLVQRFSKATGSSK